MCGRVAGIARILPLVIALGQGVAHAQTLYWIDTRYGAPTLHRSTVAGLNHTSVALTPGTLPEGLAVDGPNAMLYWVESSYTGARVMQAYENLSGASAVLTGGSCERGLALDPVTHGLYWTTSNLVAGPDLHWVGADGSNPHVVTGLGAGSNPRGIALDGGGASAFWADFDQSAIKRTDLASGATTTIVPLAAGSGPYGVARAPSDPNLYWTEYNTGRLCRIPLAGGSVTVLATGLHNPTYLAIDTDNSRVLWVEAAAGAQKIRSMPLAGGSITDLALPVASFGGIAIKPGVFVGVEPGGPAPAEFALQSIAPNPMVSASTIAFSLPHDATTRVSVMDVSGRVVAVLQEGWAIAGRHAITWDGSGADGHRVAAGLYFVRVSAGDRRLTGRLVVVGR